MDVYEKSLKTAQRGLPRKAEWGDAIVPQPQVPQPVIARLVLVDLVNYSFDNLLSRLIKHLLIRPRTSFLEGRNQHGTCPGVQHTSWSRDTVNM